MVANSQRYYSAQCSIAQNHNSASGIAQSRLPAVRHSAESKINFLTWISLHLKNKKFAESDSIFTKYVIEELFLVMQVKSKKTILQVFMEKLFFR
jgi:hypothetical protein